LKAEPDPEQEAGGRQVREALMKAMSELSAAQRSVLSPSSMR
jgi:DNA-directed RNA polymerase specialized sigma24 family protein